MPTITRTATKDAYSYAGGFYQASENILQFGNSSSQDAYTAIEFTDIQVSQGAVVNAATFTLEMTITQTFDCNYDLRLLSTINPVFPPDAAAMRTTAATTAIGTHVIPANAPNGLRTYNIAPALQEQVNKPGWIKGGSIVVIIRKAPALVGSRTTHKSIEGGGAAILSVTTPQGVDGAVTFRQPTPRLITQAEVGSFATATATFRQPAPRLYAEAEVGTPAPRAATATFRQRAPRLQLTATIGTATANTPFSFEMFDADTHAFVTEAGEVLRFSAGFDTTLGGVRTGIAGESDQPGAWFAESGLRSRLPEIKAISAHLVDRLDPRRDGDRMKRLLPDVRELWLPDGDVIGLEYVAFAARPYDDKLELILFPTGPEPQQPFLDLGTLNLALPTESSTPERPLFGFDPAGSITAPLLAKDVSKGTLKVDAYVTADGTWGLASVGPPIDAYGQTSGAAIFTRLGEGIDYVYGRVSDVQMAIKLPRLSAQKFSAVLAWRSAYARLSVTSDNGSSMVNTPLPAPLLALANPLLTAGVRSDGLAVAGFIGEPVFAPRYFDETEAETLTRRGYADLNEPGLSWAIMPPDFSLVLSRADSKSLDLAPGESLTIDFNVRRVGGYAGALTMTVVMGEGLTATAALVSQTGDIDLWRVTVTAPPGTLEAAYTLFIEVEAAGADTPGSVLAEVRDTFSSIVEVAAGPAIMPNATVVLYANDPVNKNPTEILKDSSGNNNSFLWEGLARPDIRGRGILATGVYGSQVRSLPLNNAAQAQQMNGNATICMIWGEIAKTANDGVMLQVDASGGEDGVHLQKVQGGFKLRTVIGTTTVTSPDTLIWNGDHPHLILDIGTSEIVLYDQKTGRSIKLNRPAWPDATVRLIVGGLRDSSGNPYELARAHLHTLTMHPYSLSALQRRRNMGALTPYDPGDDVTEYPDNAVGIFLWDNGRKYVNDAAPALGITAQVVGTVTELPGGVYPQGGGSMIRITTAVPMNGVIDAITAIDDIGGPHVDLYDAHLAFCDSANQTATMMLATHDKRWPFAMIANTDYSHTFRTVNKNAPGVALYRMLFKASVKRLEVTNYPLNEVVTVSSNNSYNGSLTVTLGAIWRGGSNPRADRTTKTKNMGLVLCRGEMTADAVVATKTLLST